MINEDFINLIPLKIAQLEREKRKLQIMPDSDKELKQIEEQQQSLSEIGNYPLSFASNNASNEEIEYIINIYKKEAEIKLQALNEEIEKLTDEWTDERFLNEVAAYTILDIIDSTDRNNISGICSKITAYLDSLNVAYNKKYSFVNLYNIDIIREIIYEKIPSFGVDGISISNDIEPLVAKNSKDFSDFRLKFDKKVIDYYNKYIVHSLKLSLPFSEDIRQMLSESLKPLLDKKKTIEKELENYKDIDLTDENKRNKYIAIIIEKIYQSRLRYLPFYAFYSLDKLDILIEITKKVQNKEGKKKLVGLIMTYKQKKELIAQLEEEDKQEIEFRTKYQSKYDRFNDIDKLLHKGDYSEGDFRNYFSIFINYVLYKNGVSLAYDSEFTNITNIIERQFGDNDKLIEEVELKVKKQLDESGITNLVVKYEKLTKSVISAVHKEKIKSLEKEITEKIGAIVDSIYSSYVKEGYQLFQEMPFLRICDGHSYQTSMERELEIRNEVAKNNDLLFDANIVVLYNPKEEFLSGVKEDTIKNVNTTIQKLEKEFRDFFNITKDELLFLCEINLQELDQITKSGELYKMEAVREIIANYNALDDKTLLNDDYKNESSGFGK